MYDGRSWKVLFRIPDLIKIDEFTGVPTITTPLTRTSVFLVSFKSTASYEGHHAEAVSRSNSEWCRKKPRRGRNCGAFLVRSVSSTVSSWLLIHFQIVSFTSSSCFLSIPLPSSFSLSRPHTLLLCIGLCHLYLKLSFGFCLFVCGRSEVSRINDCSSRSRALVASHEFKGFSIVLQWRTVHSESTYSLLWIETLGFWFRWSAFSVAFFFFKYSLWVCFDYHLDLVFDKIRKINVRPSLHVCSWFWKSIHLWGY